MSTMRRYDRYEPFLRLCDHREYRLFFLRWCVMEYAEKLKDPRWQKKRLQVFERDNWTCQICGNTKETLCIHHKYYEKDKEPWDYEDDCYQTLCELCHGCKYRLDNNHYVMFDIDNEIKNIIYNGIPPETNTDCFDTALRSYLMYDNLKCTIVFKKIKSK